MYPLSTTLTAAESRQIVAESLAFLKAKANYMLKVKEPIFSPLGGLSNRKLFGPFSECFVLLLSTEKCLKYFFQGRQYYVICIVHGRPILYLMQPIFLPLVPGDSSLQHLGGPHFFLRDGGFHFVSTRKGF